MIEYKFKFEGVLVSYDLGKTESGDNAKFKTKCLEVGFSEKSEDKKLPESTLVYKGSIDDAVAALKKAGKDVYLAKFIAVDNKGNVIINECPNVNEKLMEDISNREYTIKLLKDILCTIRRIELNFFGRRAKVD